MPRKICYVSGTRADFGVMRRTLLRAHQCPDLDISVVACGMHLSELAGKTVTKVRESGLRIDAEIQPNIDIDESSNISMAMAIGHLLRELPPLFVERGYEAIMVLGDRGEALAATLAAVHLNQVVIHIHGGERSGTVDEPVRHAISKLAHYHFVATKESMARLEKMGEDPNRIFITGAPGLVGIQDDATRKRQDLCLDLGLDPARPVALLLFHPVVQESTEAGHQARIVLRAVLKQKAQVVLFQPNLDAGGRRIRSVWTETATNPHVARVTHLPRPDFLSWLAAADVIVGNSSAGVIEAASFGLPVVNVGSRQHLRERNDNVVDVPVEETAIEHAVFDALRKERMTPSNKYGDGHAAETITHLLATLPLDNSLLSKFNAY